MPQLRSLTAGSVQLHQVSLAALPQRSKPSFDFSPHRCVHSRPSRRQVPIEILFSGKKVSYLPPSIKVYCSPFAGESNLSGTSVLSSPFSLLGFSSHLGVLRRTLSPVRYTHKQNMRNRPSSMSYLFLAILKQTFLKLLQPQNTETLPTAKKNLHSASPFSAHLDIYVSQPIRTNKSIPCPVTTTTTKTSTNGNVSSSPCTHPGP